MTIILRNTPQARRGRAATSLALGLILVCCLGGASCGTTPETATHSVIPPANISNQDVEKTLKYDSRVQDFDADGNKLVVNVNQQFVQSPTGIQQRALDGWFVQWKAEHAGSDGKAPAGTAVEVKFDGNLISRATDDKGIEILARPSIKSANTE
ncbi:MAG TPA: hypothetical protein VLZ81_07680 [Blastocatellia bacterium]|nr:hypothetical protein [Blastocatellia bacterium]